ncbi:MAG: NUDIX hydrolase [Gammaproteobacteria bacterium]|nr:NUDIX hydrolase [Gammaproteobacteria bacterium]
MKFCSRCAAPTHKSMPSDGDTRLRDVCTQCQQIFYKNPLNVVGTIPLTEDNQLLLCLRNIEPRKGYWTLPAGFLELGESLQAGAKRETLEESGAEVKLLDLYCIVNVIVANQVHFFYRALLQNNLADFGHETEKIEFFSLDNLPWQELAFLSVKMALKYFVADFQTSNFTLRETQITHNLIHSLL